MTLTAALGIAAIAGGFQGWALRRASCPSAACSSSPALRSSIPGAADASASSLIVAVLAMQRFIRAPAVVLAKDA